MGYGDMPSMFQNSFGGGGAGGFGGGSNTGHGLGTQKHRFCASYPNVGQCRRGFHCVFAHSRDEVQTPLLSVAEENHSAEALTEEFFTERFKTLWCPIGAQHDWHSCVYAHTYQDARRKPSVGYGPQPCPYWSKKDTRASYSQRCPLGIRCSYSHGAKEQLYHPNYFSTLTCRDMQLKGCPRRHLCAFFHKKSEKRIPAPDRLDYARPLPKEVLPAEWMSHFLAPPFFQETSENASAMQPGQDHGFVPYMAGNFGNFAHFPVAMYPDMSGGGNASAGYQWGGQHRGGQ